MFYLISGEIRKLFKWLGVSQKSSMIVKGQALQYCDINNQKVLQGDVINLYVQRYKHLFDKETWSYIKKSGIKLSCACYTPFDAKYLN